ncbi:MAG: hypothetical protein JWO19_1505 [Bryobacterales bacterium]|jgi:hypothetical protein|nr:hypothetical protein [Bryobacterales bacterium]
MKQPTGAPGTVSKILWHFTGGPRWNDKKQRQQVNPKKPGDAYAALVSILQTRTLRLGQYHELVKAQYLVRSVDLKTKAKRLESREALFKSAPVCCLADIPIAHLAYHSHRYGKFAIGFHRRAIVKHKFSPVFYSLHDSAPLQAIRRSISAVESINDDADHKAWDVSSFERQAACIEGHPIDDNAGDLSDFESAFRSIAESAENARNHVSQSLAFVKTFNQTEFSTVYCEREWRSTQEFVFDFSDVAMIVLPRQIADQTFYEDFLRQRRPRLPRSIPIVPWEDLVEH